jgi:hypothetical protein
MSGVRPVRPHPTVANPGIRTSDPLSELSDRITRIRASAWRSATHSDVLTGVAAITDYASTAVIVHTTAAATISELTGVPMRSGSRRILLVDSPGSREPTSPGRLLDGVDPAPGWCDINDQTHP